MTDKPDSRTLLNRARFQLEEGQNETALQVLEGLHPNDEEQERERNYFLGWCYVEQERWLDVVRVLAPFSQYVEGTEHQIKHINRTQHALSLLRLGYAALNIGRYEEAVRHFRKCLKLIEDKGVQIPLERLRARISIASACIQLGLISVAIDHFGEALRICPLDNEIERATIYLGLCRAYRLEKRIEHARSAGELALNYCKSTPNDILCAKIAIAQGMVELLAGEYSTAFHYCQTGLAIAEHQKNIKLLMLSYIALASLNRMQRRFTEAKQYCQRAYEIKERSNHAHLNGFLYLATGKVLLAEARATDDYKTKIKLLQEATEWFEHAKEQLSITQAFKDISELYCLLAQSQEQLGHISEAVGYWRSACQALATSRGLPGYSN